MSHDRVNYEKIAPTYDQRYGALEYAGVASTLLSLIRSTPNRVLEVGCGTGHWVAKLRPSSPHVYGLDLSAGMLEHTDQELHDYLLCGEAGRLPFADSVFDLIFCVNAFHHFGDKPGFISQASHALRSGGTLAIIGMDPHTGKDDWGLYHLLRGNPRSRPGSLPDGRVDQGMDDESWIRGCHVGDGGAHAPLPDGCGSAPIPLHAKG